MCNKFIVRKKYKLHLIIIIHSKYVKKKLLKLYKDSHFRIKMNYKTQ